MVYAGNSASSRKYVAPNLRIVEPRSGPLLSSDYYSVNEPRAQPLRSDSGPLNPNADEFDSELLSKGYQAIPRGTSVWKQWVGKFESGLRREQLSGIDVESIKKWPQSKNLNQNFFPGELRVSFPFCLSLKQKSKCVAYGVCFETVLNMTCGFQLQRNLLVI